MRRSHEGANHHRAHSASPVRRKFHRSLPPLPAYSTNLEDYQHYFRNDGRLVSMKDNTPFEFDYTSNVSYNQHRYHLIGNCVEQYIYHLLETECGLTRYSIPIDPMKNEPSGSIFASHDYRSAAYLMVIIHGSGNVRAGQWSRKLIINNGLNEGSQINYIKRARHEGYAVIVTNTNLNSAESISFPAVRIRGSGSPEEHANYVWEHFVRANSRAQICIVAHSYGGAVVLDLAHQFRVDFEQRVFAIALTDSPMLSYIKNADQRILSILQKKLINWIADKSPPGTDLRKTRSYGQIRSAGHMTHAWTSFTAFNAIFQFFQQERPRH